MNKIISVKEHDACHSMVYYEDGASECLVTTEIPKQKESPNKKATTKKSPKKKGK